ncbi:MAG: S-layer homology domain-containing protein [Deltaproteobacteria bacterium]|nr:S-layer homology domain-containing protein [Deltaproteobacteria bacterium]
MHRTLVIASGLLALATSACLVGDDAGGGGRSLTATDTATTGTLSTQSFCPDALIPRRDMARYLERIKRGAAFMPPPAQNLFSDVPRDSTQAAWIEQLYADGITRGTGPGTFGPTEPVTRQHMAAFIIRTIYGADFARGGPSRFADVDNPDFIGYIEQLADDGITKGCTPTEFCPLELVPRRQMAAFLMRAAHPGTADPASSGRFADVGLGDELGGRMEQAVSEGIMEPCGVGVSGVPVVGWTVGGGTELNPAPTIDNFLGWIHTTPNYGLYVHDRAKRYFNDEHQRMCGGDFRMTAVVDIGAVTHDNVYVRGVTFYTVGVPRIWHQNHVWVGTNGHIEKFQDWTLGMDENGTPYVYFRVEKEFPGGQGRNGDALQLQHTVTPEGGVGAGTVLAQTGDGAKGRAGLAAGIDDNPDSGWCSMIMRGALASY